MTHRPDVAISTNCQCGVDLEAHGLTRHGLDRTTRRELDSQRIELD